ncbi:DNA cytosine methyltransferase [Rhodoblastus acidophilus]|uniref:DNA (cytosine-5-)-methyltransferase n=1 Tax=Candidatus Rhodoblastus alkanivorans TaxID=2954117 RepID=A0ABS9ZBX7_9HYPH|nr:DNA cytosine methyltransferase [Candidatus Rhodoblastus alkanivorans]MCI4679349.1 DNA cytosine methyltransferase [Candidatus Rhodoblastus alkanivorans]MCI4684825.1 DNA cytosine methyltransferase [Candidatus Rhodoblastus alkanivorans]MDI4642149.1 DNA cytosine methyltransferase [Rhodoblastus acidophilus]
MPRPLTFYEFFAGGGMARLGLGGEWTCLFANDIDADKAAAYRANWGDAEFVEGDLATIAAREIPGRADLAWASFPCQDLSLAGGGKGMGAAGDAVKTRSGAFWLFHEKMRALRAEGRAPRAVVLENVVGVLTSHGMRDFCAVVAALDELGYRTGALTLDARWFTPQSRPRVFFVAVQKSPLAAPARAGAGLVAHEAQPLWTSASLRAARAALPAELAANWQWWRLPEPARRNAELAELLEDSPADAPWRPPAATERLLALMAPAHRQKIAAIQASGARRVGAVFRRTRTDENGLKRQRAEVRFDGLAGCLRTPRGGSSRQTIMEVHRETIRTRLLSPREAARLMGLPDSYRLPPSAGAAYELCGDGLCAPVVRHLAEHLLQPLLRDSAPQGLAAAE